MNYKKVAIMMIGATIISSVVFAEEISSSKNVTTDTLLSAGESTLVTSDIPMVSIPQTNTRNAIHNYAVCWVEDNKKFEQLELKKANHENLTSSEEQFLDSLKKSSYDRRLKHNLNYRIEGFKRAHNWNSDNKQTRYYNYEYLNGYTDRDGFINSYGWNVLQVLADKINDNIYQVSRKNNSDIAVTDIENAILSPINETATVVNNDELRYYADHLVWFATMQSVKEMHLQEGISEH